MLELDSEEEAVAVENHGIIGMKIKLISKIEIIRVFMRKILIKIHIE
jgi:hypothetical protein